MTSEEGDLLHDICEHYWSTFSALIAAELQKVPPHLHDHLLLMLQDKSSVYGSSYKRYMPK